MSKRGIPVGAVVRGTDKGYDDAPKVPLKPGSDRPVENIEKVYPYMRPRDAATLILVRMKGKTPEVLMGCRAAAHAFMPNRYVFPGGKVDPDDARVGVRAAQEGGVQAARRRDVVDERGPTAQERRIFDPQHPRTDVAGGHEALPPPVPVASARRFRAAACTAATMPV